MNGQPQIVFLCSELKTGIGARIPGCAEHWSGISSMNSGVADNVPPDRPECNQQPVRSLRGL